MTGVVTDTTEESIGVAGTIGMSASISEGADCTVADTGGSIRVADTIGLSVSISGGADGDGALIV